MADYLSSVLNEYGLGDKKDKEPSYLDSVLGEYGLGEQKAPASRNIAAVANDLVITGANAALGGAQAVSDFISPNNKFSQGVEELIKEGEAKQSDVVKEGRRKLGQALDTEDIGTQLRGVKDFVLENPGQAAAMAAGSFAIPFGAIKGAKGASQLFGLGEKAASRVALGTGMTTSGVLAGGDAAGDAYQAVMNSPALADRTIEERERLASDAARKASVVPFVLGAASGLVGADRALATGTRSLLKTGAAEFASEAVEEGATKLSANIAADLAGAEVGTFRGVAGAAALGGVLGGGTGLAVGAMTKQPDSLLAGSTNISSGQISPDENAINKAIDANSSEITASPRPTPTSLSGWPDQLLNSTLQFQLGKGREANVELIQQIDEEIARRGGSEVVDSQAQVRNAQLQQQQQAAQAQQQAAQAQAAQVETLRADVFNKYGGQTTTLPGGTKPVFNFLGKQYFTVNDMNKAVDAVLAKEQTKPPMVREVEGALASVIPVVGAKPYTPAKMASFLNPYLNEAESIAEVADRIDARLANIKPNSPESDTLTALRNVLRGEPAEGNITQLNQGVNDGQQQLQNNAGLRAVSEQGGTTQTGGTGSVRPTNLQSVQSGSVDAGSLGLQTGALPSGGVSTGPNAGRGGINIPNAGSGQAQGQGQVNASQPQVTTKKRRSVVPDQAAQRARSPEQQSEEEATNLVETVVRNVIDAVVKRRGRMSNVNLEKLKDFIYYDFSQVENRKEGIAGLTKKELAEMFDVSTDTIDGWQDIANNFFEQNRGVIQAQLYQALDDSGMTLLQLKEQIQATRENVLNDAITLEEGQTLSEVTMEDEADFEQNAIETAAAADQELTEMTSESQLDQRELGAEDSGMTVMTGRKGASVQEQNKPEETVNARYIRKAKELEAAENSGDEALVAKLSKELDDLVNEASGIAKKQVAKSEAMAGEKKGTKDAVQKRSTKGVSVRKQAEAGQGVPSKDTEGGKAAAKGKANEEVSSLTVEEQAAKAWDAAAKSFPDAPKFAELTEDQQADFVSFGPENWTADDVQTELIKLAKQEMKTPKSSTQESFSDNEPLIDPQAVEIDQELRGKTLPEVMKWALSQARNDYERTVLRYVDARMKELTELGVEFSFAITNPGKQLRGGALGVSIYTPAGLGEAQKIEVILNGAHTGDRAGTTFEVISHELIHAVTQAQVKFAPEGTAAKELKQLFNEIAGYYNKRAKEGKLNEFEKRYFQGENNSLKDPDELLAWGITNREFQEYLASIQLEPKVTMWTKFVSLIANVFNMPVSANSALARVMSLSENILSEPLKPYVAEANKRFQSFGKQPNLTKFPTWSLNADHGAPVWVEGNYALYRAESVTGALIFLPGKLERGTSAVASVDVSAFTGNLPADVLAKMQQVADGLRVQSSAMQTISSKALTKAREQSQKQMARLPKSVGGPLQALMDNIYGFAKKGLPTFAFTEDLADVASKLLPSAKKYISLSNERNAIRTRLNLQVDKVLKLYDKLPESVKGIGENSANKLIKDFTEKGKWGYDPGWVKGGVALDPELKARFEAMPVEAQNLIKAVFTHGKNTLLLMQKSVTENINSEYDALIADAKKSGDKKEEAELIKKKAAELANYSTLMRINSKSPYAPLKRFGNYVVVGFSQEYLENETIANSKTAAPDVIAEARKKVRELEVNDMHYFVQFAETRGEAKAIARAEEGNYALVDLFEKDQSNSYGGRDVQNMFYRMRNMVEESKDSNLIDASEKTMNRLLTDLHLTLLSEQSARQSERRRRGIAGAEDDMMRSFATQGRATANFIASLSNTGSIYDVLREMKQEADARGGTSTREERRRYYNEFMKRHFMGMDYTPSPYIDKALSVTSAWMLLTNPMYFFQNMTQAFMMSLPVVGAKHGYAKSWKEFTKAYKEVFSVIKDGGLNEATYDKLPADVRNVVKELVNRGRIDISLEQDLGRWRSTEDAKLAKFGRASELLRTMAQNIETVNRVATAIATYRLESKVSNPTRALNYTDKLIYATHLDYTPGNAPRFTRQGIGRLATQFRKFQLGQISLMVRLFNDAFNGEDAETRIIGKRALAFTVGHTAVVGGAMGLPGFYAVAALYGMLFADEDEPDNPELALRRAIGNDTIADLLVKGVPAAFGADLSGKLGMGQMLSLFPYSNVDISRKGVYELVGTAVTGPFGALLGKTAEGISYMSKGEYYKGIEQMLPTGLSNVAKSYRFATEGVTNRAGDVLLKPEELDFLETMMTALGLPPKQITDRQFLQATKFEFDEFYNDKASEIKRAYTRASKENDIAAQAKAREDWKKLQESRAKNGYAKQPLSSLLKAPQEQKKRERNVAGGVQFNRANKGFVRQTSEL
jgi:hypothetical protein